MRLHAGQSQNDAACKQPEAAQTEKRTAERGRSGRLRDILRTELRARGTGEPVALFCYRGDSEKLSGERGTE